MQAEPDCCDSPTLSTAKPIWLPPGPVRLLKRCDICGAWWRYDDEDRMVFDGGPDRSDVSYTRLTDDEANRLREEG